MRLVTIMRGLLVVGFCGYATHLLAQPNANDRLSDVASVPYKFERAMRQAFPAAIVDEPRCHTFKTATSCTVDFEFLTVQSRRAVGGCSVQFYGGATDAVFEAVSCSVVGPPDGSITTAERAHLLEVRNVLLRIVVDRTAANLPQESRMSLATSISAAAGQHVVIGEWDHAADDTTASHILGVSARRGFKPVTDEHGRRFRGR